MPLYRFADFVFDIQPRYDYTLFLCKDYEVKDGVPDFVIKATEEECQAEKQRALSAVSSGYCEGMVIYRKICNAVAAFDTMLLHGATVKVAGKAYAFCVPSGTGKTTHIHLWKLCYKDKVTVLNGDKPLLRKKGDTFFAYGTPWCGKEGWNTNDSAPLSAICFLERAKTNSIRRLSKEEALMRIFEQLLKPSHIAGVEALLSMTDALLSYVPMYLLSCDISEEAAALSFETMTK